MNITSAKYKNDLDGNDAGVIEAVIDGVTSFVPKTTDNRHFRAIQEWVAEGNTIADAD
jgi:hypothetical protein